MSNSASDNVKCLSASHPLTPFFWCSPPHCFAIFSLCDGHISHTSAIYVFLNICTLHSSVWLDIWFGGRVMHSQWITTFSAKFRSESDRGSVTHTNDFQDISSSVIDASNLSNFLNEMNQTQPFPGSTVIRLAGSDCMKWNGALLCYSHSTTWTPLALCQCVQDIWNAQQHHHVHLFSKAKSTVANVSLPFFILKGSYRSQEHKLY